MDSVSTDESTLVWKVQINPRTTAKDLARCWRKQVQKYLYLQQKKPFMDLTLKATQQERGHCSKTATQKQDCSLQLSIGTKVLLTRETSSGLIEPKRNSLTIKTSVQVRRKGGGSLQPVKNGGGCFWRDCYFLKREDIMKMDTYEERGYLKSYNRSYNLTQTWHISKV